VENATLPERRETWCSVGTLAEAARQSVEGPALIIIGCVLDKAMQCAQAAEASSDQADNFPDYGHARLC
jgi:siroheme synthase